MQTWKEFRFGKTKVVFILNTKRHVWEVYFNELIYGKNEPNMIFTKAKGNAVIEFIESLLKIQQIQG